MDETDIARLTRERDEAHTRYNALLWQIANEGCVSARVGKGTRECGLPECGLCRLVHERDFYKQNSAALGDALRIGNAKLEAAEARAASLSHELLDAMQARDSYRASAELRVGMRREFEELLNVGDTMAPETFEAGLVRLRALRAAESRAAIAAEEGKS